ncbi:dynein axonemal assembly factor 1 homolog [Battus philenor]|uniref:dynein axonemal assembly factor 1 homolog n=1 Tax=Battus philenor TaxID=42288 RepID=UPI0035CF4BAF
MDDSLDFIEKKREELKIFFQDSKFSSEVLEKIIENELKPLKNKMNENSPYISASSSGEVKSEYEVMTGQPFTEVKESNTPFTTDEINEMLQNNPIIIEKSRQIQIPRPEAFNKDISVPLDKINLPCYSEMTDEIKSAGSDIDKIKNIKLKNMQALVNCATEYEASLENPEIECNSKEIDNEESGSDDSEFEAIEKVVAEYTNKSYGTRFQETKDMLVELADQYDEPGFKNVSDIPKKTNVPGGKILKESSSYLSNKKNGRNLLEEIKEEYSVNAAMNIPLVNKPVNLKVSSETKVKTGKNKDIQDEDINFEQIFPKSFEDKLKDTNKALTDIDDILNCSSTTLNPISNIAPEKGTENIENVEKFVNVELPDTKQSFDENMEQTLQSALETILDIGDNQNRENKDLEFKEMKNLARNIVEGAENLSTIIRSDITNKLNTMNELLNDVNVALENSRKSNILYQNLMNENKAHKSILPSQNSKNAVDKVNNNNEDKIIAKSTVSLSEINDIHNAINDINKEISCHEERVNKSEKTYQERNKECTEFIKEVDKILEKSHRILHPSEHSNAATLKEHIDNVNKSYKEEPNDLSEFKKRELERNQRIDGLLVDIKDKMKDNKEVLRIADRLLKRGEIRHKPLSEKSVPMEPETTDCKAKGDFVIEGDDLSKPKDTIKDTTNSDVPPEMNTKARIEVYEQKKKDEMEQRRQKQREFQEKLDKEMEEMKRGPRMTKEFIRNHCKQHKLYCTPHLNDILYLHFKGFSKIENLEEYTGLKCIFLENNGIQRIEGLDKQTELKCLYLHYNVVRKIENLQGCPKLDTLNLDHNFVTKIENLDVVPDLHTLSIAHNMLASVDDLEQLMYCKNLSVLDLSHNRLEDPLIVDVLANMVILKVLVLTGNPVIRNIPAYRKTLTLRLKELLNLDNRPVFPRDRACAEAWQRGGVQEEIAERKRWIAADHEKTMQSVRYLIRMREEKKAEREAKEKEEKEKLGLLDQKNDDNEVSKAVIKEPAKVEDETEVVQTKDGVLVDMLTGSEEEDSTSEDSDTSSDSDKEEQNASTSEINWQKTTANKTLVQEITEEESICHSQPEEYWSGYRGDMQPTEGKKEHISDLDAISNLLFNQPSHVSTSKDGIKSKDEVTTGELQSASEVLENNAKTKPLIEIIETVDDKHNDKVTEDISIEINDGQMPEEQNKVFDVKVNNVENEKNLSEDSNIQNSSSIHSNKLLKHIIIEEIKREDSQTKLEESDCKDSGNTDSNEKSEADDHQGKSDEDHKADEGSSSARPDNSNSPEDGVALYKYIRGNGDDDDLKPSAEDLEIFAELEKEQVEREARIARGEPAVDPMKLYDKEVMDAYHEAQDRTPAHCLPPQQRCQFTTYRNDNAYDRIALSQLTGGEKPDEKKATLTYVPGAVLFQYTNNEIQYEIGDETVNSLSSTEDTNSTDSCESDTSTDREPEQVKNDRRRPGTAKTKICVTDAEKTKSKDLEDVKDVSEAETREENNQDVREQTPAPSTSYSMTSAECDEAKQSIIDTINSYDDERFPSQGTNFADMAEDACVEQSVAVEILNRTLKYEEEERYRQLDLMNSHAGKIDNRTNSIIEHISDQFEHEYSLPEVSYILEVHMDEAERRWRAGEFVPFASQASPPDSDIDEGETTLTQSHNNTFEETLVEEFNKNTACEATTDVNTSVEKENDGLPDCIAGNVDREAEKVTDEKETKEDNVEVDEQFEDCIEDLATNVCDSKEEVEEFELLEEKYSLEMKLALGDMK